VLYLTPPPSIACSVAELAAEALRGLPQGCPKGHKSPQVRHFEPNGLQDRTCGASAAVAISGAGWSISRGGQAARGAPRPGPGAEGPPPRKAAPWSATQPALNDMRP